MHRLSPVLTLQGAVAHSDMPVETGPTMYLPHSQKYEPGYLAWRLPEFRDYFDDHHVQLPLAKGDAAFFNPALFHGAGTNRRADIRRMANLLQVSSAFGRAMETVDRAAMVARRLPGAAAARRGPAPRRDALANAVAAAAEGYPFPTNLDRDAAGRRAGPAEPGRDRAPGTRRGLDPGALRAGDAAGTTAGTAPTRTEAWHCWTSRSSWSAAAPRGSARRSPRPPYGRGPGSSSPAAAPRSARRWPTGSA